MGKVASRLAVKFYRIIISLKIHIECFRNRQRNGLYIFDYLAVLSFAHFHGVFSLGEYLRAKDLSIYSDGIGDLVAFFLHNLHDLVGFIDLERRKISDCLSGIVVKLVESEGPTGIRFGILV